MKIRTEFIVGMISILVLIIIIFFSMDTDGKKISQSSDTISPALTIAEQQLTSEVIAKHSSASDCWLIINNKVYAVSSYLDKHPGGANRIIDYCGKDASEAFNTKGGRGSHSDTAVSYLNDMYIGDLNGAVVQKPHIDKINSLPVKNEDDDD